MTKVKELVAALQKLPQDATVIMSRDSEGNSFSHFAGYDVGVAVEGSPGPLEYKGLIAGADVSGANCVVLYPSH